MQDYLNILKAYLPSDWEYVEEQCLNWDGLKTTLILKTQTGTNYYDTKVIPFQIVVLTNDPITVKGILEVFSQNYTNTYFNLGLNTCKHSFFTPIIPVVATPTGNQLSSEVILTGTIIISFGVSDIMSVNIDGVDYETTSRKLNLVNQIVSEGNVNDSYRKQKASILSSQVQLEFSIINKNNTFCNSIRNIRTGTSVPSLTYQVKLYYSDNSTVETYTMCVTSATLISENTDMPVLSVVMLESE